MFLINNFIYYLQIKVRVKNSNGQSITRQKTLLFVLRKFYFNLSINIQYKDNRQITNIVVLGRKY